MNEIETADSVLAPKSNRSTALLSIFLAIVCTVLSCVCIYLNTELSKVENELNFTIKDKETFKAYYLEEKEMLRQVRLENSRLLSDYQYSEQMLYAVTQRFDEIYGDYWFYNEYSCVTLPTGNKYHKPSCQYVGTKTVYITTKKLAEWDGYTACLVCF